MGGLADRRAGVADVPYPNKITVAFELIVIQPLCLERTRRAQPSRAGADDADRIAAVARERLGRGRCRHGRGDVRVEMTCSTPGG